MLALPPFGSVHRQVEFPPFDPDFFIDGPCVIQQCFPGIFLGVDDPPHRVGNVARSGITAGDFRETAGLTKG